MNYKPCDYQGCGRHERPFLVSYAIDAIYKRQVCAYTGRHRKPFIDVLFDDDGDRMPRPFPVMQVSDGYDAV